MAGAVGDGRVAEDVGDAHGIVKLERVHRGDGIVRLMEADRVAEVVPGV